MTKKFKQSKLRAGQNSPAPNLNLTVVYHRIDKLIRDPTNPRVHSKKTDPAAQEKHQEIRL